MEELRNATAPASAGKRPSAFDQGHRAAFVDAMVGNPFRYGSPEHNNFEVGRRFGSVLNRDASRDFSADFFHRLD